MFFEIWKDYGNVVHGGLWFDPDNEEFVEITDLESASGVDGVSMIERGFAAIDEKSIEEGARSMGLDKQEAEPLRGKLGPKEWRPRPGPWPPPKPGHLFWIPDEAPLGPIMRAWRLWDEFKRGGGTTEDLAGEERDLITGVLRAAEAAHAYRGIDGVQHRILIAERGSDNAKDLERVAQTWGATEWSVTSNPTSKIWKILKKKYGIKKE